MRSASIPAAAGAVAVTDKQRLSVEPDGVAALGGGGRGDPGCDRHPGRLEPNGNRLGLALASRLAGAKEGGALVTDQHRVVHVDRVGVASIVLGDDHLGAGSLEQHAQSFVLLRGGRVVGDAAPAVALDMALVLGQRSAHKHSLEVAPHRLAAVAEHGSQRYATALAGVRPSSSTARSAPTQSMPIATRVSRVALPRCGESTTFSSGRSASVTSGSRS